jgi:hypothetical protein
VRLRARTSIEEAPGITCRVIDDPDESRREWGTRMRIYRPVVFGVIGLNLLWALDSVALLLSGRVAPTALGSVFTLGQALIVAAVAQLEFVGLRRSTPML